MCHERCALDRLFRLLRLLLLGICAAVFYKFLFRPLLPVAAAFLLSGLLCGPTKKMSRRVHLPPGLCALTLLAAMTALTLAAGLLLWRFLYAQLTALSELLPGILHQLQERYLSLHHYLNQWFPGISFSVSDGGQELLASLPQLGAQGLLGSLSRAAATLPDGLLTVVFVPAAAVMMVCSREQMATFFRRQLPEGAAEIISGLYVRLRDMLRGWLKAQALLALATSVLLLAGFLLLKVQSPWLLAPVIALLDALPVLGAGLALLPWAVLELMLGNSGRAAGLALLYCLLLALRNALEPHLLGREVGLPPLVSLLSFFLGWKLLGLWGMVLGPAAALVLAKWREWGYNQN